MFTAPAILTPLAAILPLLALISGLAMAPLMIVAAFASTIALASRHMFGDIWQNRISEVFLIALFYPALTLSWTPVVSDASMHFLRVMGIIASGIIVLHLNTLAGSTRPRIIERTLVVGVLLALTIACIEITTQGFVVKELLMATGRTHFTMEDLNRGACILAIIAWPASLALYRLGYRKNAYLLGIAILLILSHLESLAATLAMATGLAAAAMIIFLRQYGAIIIRIGIVAVILLTPIIAVNLTKAEYYREFIPGLPDSALHRIYIWKFAAEKAQEQPILGWGFRSSRHIDGGDQDSYAKGKVMLPQHPHNAVLQVWLELGLVGVAIYLAIVLAVLRSINLYCRHYFDKACCTAMLVSYLTIGMLAFDIWQIWWIATGWLGASFCAYMVSGSSHAHMQRLKHKIAPDLPVPLAS